MPSTVNIVSGSTLVANIGFIRIGGAKIVTKSQIYIYIYKHIDTRDLINDRAKDLDDIARSIIASSLVMTAKTIVTAVTWLDCRVKDTRISLTIQKQEESVASSECNARYLRGGRLAFTTVDNLPLFTLSRS